MPQSRSADDRAAARAREIVVQPRRFSWATVIAGLCIALTGGLLWDVGGWPSWLSILQVVIGLGIVADGARHLLRRRRLLGDD